MESSTEHQSLGISEHSPVNTLTDLEDWLTSLREASPASRFQSLESREESTTKETCGHQPLQQLELLDHPIVSWKTSQGSWESIDTLRLSSKTFPKRGMMSDGLACRLPKLELSIKENVFGFLLPTIASSRRGPTKQFIPNAKCSSYRSLETFAARWTEATHRFPTPTAKSYGSNQDGAKKSGPVRLSLESMARKNLWSTPNTLDHMAPKTPKALEKEMTVTRKGRTNVSNLRDQVTWGRTFAEATDRLPTPMSRDWKDTGRGASEKSRNTPGLATHAGGQLSPQWVELLMGFPIGSTALEPMDKEVMERWLQTDFPTEWSTGEFERGVPRTCQKLPKRKERLTGLGNAQVPQCMVLAWGLLTHG